MNAPLQRLHRQNLVHFNTETIILYYSTQLTLTTNQNIQITSEQFVDNVRQLNSQSTQQTTKAPTPYYLQAAST